MTLEHHFKTFNQEFQLSENQAFLTRGYAKHRNELLWGLDVIGSDVD